MLILAFLLSSVLSFQDPVGVTPSDDPIVALSDGAPGPPNPYCGHQKNDFPPPPVPDCTDGTLDQTCLGVCRNTYRTTMLSSYNAACESYKTFNRQYVQRLNDMIDDYDRCMAQATSPAGRQECRNTLALSMSLAVDTLLRGRQSIVDSLREDGVGATLSFQTCATRCCFH